MIPEADQVTSRPSGIRAVPLENELKISFLDYAMSVIVSRALPDVRDGLKPVHRRVLYTMYQLGFTHAKPYHKSARVVGDVLGRYHPHGDQAVYQTMVGMVQDFSKRYPLLDGQGNWGSVDGDSAAAMRYTEVRMAKIAQELLADLDKNTVAFVPNFDESTTEPVVMPSKIPHLLVNGSSGIAVGMATSIPPHNLGEVIDACLMLIKNSEISDDQLFSIVKAPDFPTGGIICGRTGILRAYRTGRGNAVVRAVTEIEETAKGSAIVVTQLPYQVNKADLAVKIAELVKEKVIDGISNIRDESNKKGMRLVIELRRGEMPLVVLNQLYKHSDLQVSISILMLGLLDHQPMIFSLRELLRQFLLYRQEVVQRRTVYDLQKAQAREHILNGLVIALKDIDAVVQLIKKSANAEQAIAGLHERFELSEVQAKAILEMRLQRLTGLEQEKIQQELHELGELIKQLTLILNDKVVLQGEIVKELEYIKQTYADERRSVIAQEFDVLTEADLIPDEDVVVTLTYKGYVKRVLLETYGVQHRGGKGKIGISALDESDDIVQDVFVARNHDELLFFTNLGRVYSLQVFQVPEASRTAKGRAVINLLALAEGERVVKLLCTRDLDNCFIVMLSKKGIIKKTEAAAFAKIRATGIRALTLNEGDELVSCAISTGNDQVIIATAHGQGIHFKEEEVRAMGRQAAGVIGIRVRNNDYVVGMQVISSDDQEVLFATQKGYGKRVRAGDFRVSHRGGVGVRTIPTTKRNGLVVGLVVVSAESHILLVDSSGKIIRLSPAEVRTMGRQAQGVRLIRLDDDRTLTSVVEFQEQESDEPDESKQPEHAASPEPD